MFLLHGAYKNGGHQALFLLLPIERRTNAVAGKGNICLLLRHFINEKFEKYKQHYPNTIYLNKITRC